eukprot:2507911-Alexandrium_andersonii.AAC.1
MSVDCRASPEALRNIILMPSTCKYTVNEDPPRRQHSTQLQASLNDVQLKHQLRLASGQLEFGMPVLCGTSCRL